MLMNKTTDPCNSKVSDISPSLLLIRVQLVLSGREGNMSDTLPLHGPDEKNTPYNTPRVLRIRSSVSR